ncbi:uncharacterized protein LOC142239173 [Haematobia irritans]|uniref:uncharacterized protein LOC142239173 n=1 Tax=Haematobia irritans TaxID=7368 RepID=UPI003F4F5DD1
MISYAVFISIIVILFLRLSHGEQNWYYDILKVEVKYDNPDVLNGSVKATRVARGVYLANGFLDIKQDLTDDCELGMEMFYSPTGLKNSFVRTPFAIARSKLSHVFNNYYKPIAMKSIMECTDNAPYTEDVFKPPVTKRLIIFTNCSVSTENMPSHMKSGYYRNVFTSYNQCSGYLLFETQVNPI